MAEVQTQRTSLASALGEGAAEPIAAGIPNIPGVPAAPAVTSDPDMPSREPREKLGQTSPPVVAPAKGNGLAKPAVKSAKEMLGLRESPKKELDAMAKELRKRSEANEIPLKEAPKPKAAAPAKPKEEEPSPVAKPTPEAAPVEAKIKVGNKEFTAKELEAHVKALEEKAKGVAAPDPKKPDPAAPAKKSEEIEAETKAARDTYLNKASEDVNLDEYGLGLDENTHDLILAGGPEAVKATLAREKRLMVAAELRVMSRLEKELNPILETLNNRMSPLAEQHEQIRAYQAEQKFFEKHPDLEPVRDNVRVIRGTIISNYQKAKTAVNEGKGTDADKYYVSKFESMSADDLDTETAEHVREIAKSWAIANPGQQQPGTAPAAPVAAAPAAPAPVARPKPPTGQLPGSPPPRSANGQGGILGMVRAHEHI